VALGSPRSDGVTNPPDGAAAPGHPGEPGIGPDLSPPFTAADDATRWLFNLNRFGIRPGLTRIQGLLEDLGNPQRDLRVLTTAGTNGKGGTTRILARLLQDGGRKVAAYTSPHLLQVHERIQINERQVDPADFARRVEAIRPLVEKHEASWFETLTALAVQIARDEGVDYLCCETGLGGRLDASNALTPEAVLVTTVGLDHQHILGETLEEIAVEKLGLLRRGVPLFCGVGDDLRSLVFRTSVVAGSPCYFLDELARWGDTAAGTWDLTLRERVFAGLPDPGTAAMRRNVALALLALSELPDTAGGDLLPARPAESLRNLFLPGRYHRVFDDPAWIFDTAHNTQALDGVLTEFLQRPSRGRRVILFGAMHDKQMPVELGELLTGCDHLVGAPISLPRSRTAAELADLFATWRRTVSPWPAAGAGLPPTVVAPHLDEALARVVAATGPGDEILVTGSCFIVAEALHKLGIEELDSTRTPRPADAIRLHPKEDRT
jgi:dihydrofolate synthase/folylpolyglutamate synthase